MTSSPLDAETIWQMVLPTLLQNNNHILLPEHIARILSDHQINYLKDRLSQLCGAAPVAAFTDFQGRHLRISPMPESHVSPVISSLTASPSVASHSPSLLSIPSPVEEAVSTQSLLNAKKSKVPRPPNAFILYRQKHHPLLKADHPDIMNNDISVILGRQWRNEPEHVKNEYKSLAENIKRKHARDHPGYQYAPRKPSEKKRRMTAKKMAAQKAAAEETSSQDFSPSEMIEVADHVSSESESFLPMVDAETWLGTARPPSAIHVDDRTLDVTLALPTTQQSLQERVATHYHGVDGLLEFDPQWLSTASASQVTNEQDFIESLIDWDGVQQDLDTIRGATAEERDELAAVETGTSQQISWDLASTDEFQKDLDRIMMMV